MIIGAHVLLYSRRPKETRELLAKILGSRGVDAGGGWLILPLPPAEIGVHPTEGRQFQEVYLMCDDLDATLAELAEKGMALSGPVEEAEWGAFTHLALPGGGKLGLYQPRHPLALAKPRRSGARAGPSGKKRPAGKWPPSRSRHQ